MERHDHHEVAVVDEQFDVQGQVEADDVQDIYDEHVEVVAFMAALQLVEVVGSDGLQDCDGLVNVDRDVDELSRRLRGELEGAFFEQTASPPEGSSRRQPHLTSTPIM